MKKSLLLLFAAVLSLQVMNAAPSRAELPENQRILGHYDSDAVGTEGAKINSTGKLTIGTILENEELDIFNGGKIVAFRVGLAESTPVSKVFVIPVTAGGAYGSMVSWACNVSETGWNVIDLPSPYLLDIPEDGKLMIGFEYEQTSTSKPLALVNEGDEIYDTYLYKKAGGMYRWTTAGLKSHGNLCVQCIVEKDHFPEVLIKTSNLECVTFSQVGDPLPYSFAVKNRGSKPIDVQAMTFDVKVDGEKVGTISNPEALEAGSTATLMGELVTDGMASGNHVLTIDHAVVGDEELDYVFPMNASFMLHNGTFPRQKHLVEQYTSTYCTYCPLGNSMLSLLTGQRDDIIWVGVHGNLGTGVDPYTTYQGDSIMSFVGNSSYPSASFDRSTGWESDRVIVSSIGYYEEYHQQIADELGGFFDYVAQQHPTFASIEIAPVVDLDTREAVITVSGEMSPDFDAMLGEGCKLTVYLTEDSIIARQLNNGKWESQYVHNGVFRQALGSVKGVDFNKTGDGYSNEFKVTIPGDWNIYNVNVVAFISRPLAGGNVTDMYLNNAEAVRLVKPTHGVNELATDGSAVPVEYYDVMGRKMDGPHKGINIVMMSNGTVKKVLVK